LNAVDWILDFREPILALSEELWRILPASKSTVRNMHQQVATWLQAEKIMFHFNFLSKYGKTFWFKEAKWSEEGDAVTNFPPGFKSAQMPFHCLARIRRLNELLKDDKFLLELKDPLSPENREECEKQAKNFLQTALKTHKEYSKKWLQTPLIFGAIADPQNFRPFVAACLLAYSIEKKRQLGRNLSLFHQCIVPVVLDYWCGPQDAKFMHMVIIIHKGLVDSSKEEGLQNFWSIMDRTETVLSLLALLQSFQLHAVEVVKNGKTAIFKWLQNCIFSTPHQNRSVEGTFNGVDQILASHENVSPSKLESLQRFLQNEVSPKKKKFTEENPTKRWRPTKAALKDLLGRVSETTPSQKEVHQAKEALKKEAEKAKSADKLKLTKREQAYLQLHQEYKEKAPKKRKPIDFGAKASTLDIQKLEKVSQKKMKEKPEKVLPSARELLPEVTEMEQAETEQGNELDKVAMNEKMIRNEKTIANKRATTEERSAVEKEGASPEQEEIGPEKKKIMTKKTITKQKIKHGKQTEQEKKSATEEAVSATKEKTTAQERGATEKGRILGKKKPNPKQRIKRPKGKHKEAMVATNSKRKTTESEHEFPVSKCIKQT